MPMNCHYIGPVIWKAFPCYDVNLRDGNLPLSFHSLLSGDLYTSLNWVAFRLGNGLGFIWWWGQRIYRDQFCWWLLQYASATTILLFNSLCGLTTKKTPRQHVPVPLWGEWMYYWEFPLQRASTAQMHPWHDVIMRNSNKLKHFLYFIHWWQVYCFNEDYESSVWQLLSSLAAPWVVVMTTCGVTVKTLLMGSWRS